MALHTRVLRLVLSGLSYDALHGVGNFVLMLLLYRPLRRALHPHRLPGLGDQRGRADHGVSRTIWNCLRFALAISAENYF